MGGDVAGRVWRAGREEVGGRGAPFDVCSKGGTNQGPGSRACGWQGGRERRGRLGLASLRRGEGPLLRKGAEGEGRADGQGEPKKKPITERGREAEQKGGKKKKASGLNKGTAPVYGFSRGEGGEKNPRGMAKIEKTQFTSAKREQTQKKAWVGKNAQRN